MEKKMRQVTDNIHGTIYLSDLESELISTPYFYRLHDIYQNSTVYMTFPSNRTKRYEHSLGTMALASRIVYSSVINADEQTRSRLFNKLKSYSCEIAKSVLEKGDPYKLYFTNNETDIDGFFDTFQDELDENFILKCIQDAIKSGEFLNSALDYHQYYPVEGLAPEEGNKIENIYFYRCLLQAIRIVALFHDVGHPPYSHIIEDALSELYETIENGSPDNWKPKKVEKFKKCLSPFFSKESGQAYKCRRLFSNSSLLDAKPHERIGLSLLDQAINDVIPSEVANVVSSEVEPRIKLAHILYYITVVEFTFAILVEKDINFKSFHKIVDGIIDADRLDYIVRDSQNSGVDWGVIPYERIINSAKLFSLTADNLGNRLPEDKIPFVIAYPQKISDDIEDLLLVRYKIFARINFHHRCMKTAMALQAAVKELAIDYLSNDDSKCISNEISTLWLAHDDRVGNKKIRIIQWNDSWLISVLHKALVKIYVTQKTSEKTKKLREDLEEILLNKKKYYSLLKRGNDNNSFVQRVLEKTGITKENVEKIKQKEYAKYYSNDMSSASDNTILLDPRCDALDSICRMDELLENFDLQLLYSLIPLEGQNITNIIKDVLNAFPGISDSAVLVNRGKNKTGLPSHKSIFENIYLYNDDKCFPYNERLTLLQQIQAIQKHVPWLYIYFAPSTENTDTSSLSSDLLEVLANTVAKKLSSRLVELFPNDYPRINI